MAARQAIQLVGPIWRVDSRSNPGEKHDVQRRADGVLFCDCLGWRFCKNPKHCRHTDDVNASLGLLEQSRREIAQAEQLRQQAKQVIHAVPEKPKRATVQTTHFVITEMLPSELLDADRKVRKAEW